jgi:FMN phosphatase YigB (HAD superfamily)
MLSVVVNDEREPLSRKGGGPPGRYVHMAKLKLIFFDIGDTLVSKGNFIAGAEEVLKQLRAKGVRLGLLSDTANMTRAEVSKLLPPGFLDSKQFEKDLVILSSELSAKLGHPVDKSKIEIFQHVLGLTGLSPQECLFCTEDLTHTLIAQQTGMLTARLQKPPAESDIGDLIKALTDAGLL